jgi:hypothetical protein
LTITVGKGHGLGGKKTWQRFLGYGSLCEFLYYAQAINPSQWLFHNHFQKLTSHQVSNLQLVIRSFPNELNTTSQPLAQSVMLPIPRGLDRSNYQGHEGD